MLQQSSDLREKGVAAMPPGRSVTATVAAINGPQPRHGLHPSSQHHLSYTSHRQRQAHQSLLLRTSRTTKERRATTTANRKSWRPPAATPQHQPRPGPPTAERNEGNQTWHEPPCLVGRHAGEGTGERRPKPRTIPGLSPATKP